MKQILSDKAWLGLLGVGNGLTYSGIMLLLIWQWRSAAFERNVIQSLMTGDYVDFVANERWVPIVILWILAFILASQLVDCFWQRGRGLILFWLAVGVLAIAAWNVFALVGAWLDKQGGDTISYSRVTAANDPLYGPLSLGLVILINFFYGYLVQTFSRRMKMDVTLHRAVR